VGGDRAKGGLEGGRGSQALGRGILDPGPALPRSEGGRNRKGGGREEGRKGGREGEGDMVCWEGPWLVSGRMGEKKAQERRGDGRCRRLVRIPSNETEMTGDG